MLFENRLGSARDLVSKALSAAREWQSCQLSATIGSKKGRVQNHPETLTHSHVIRSDAAWKAGSPFAGLGWTITSHGRTAEFSAWMSHIYSPLMAESIAMKEALTKGRELGISGLRLEADSKILVESIKKGTLVSEIYGVVSINEMKSINTHSKFTKGRELGISYLFFYYY